MPAGRPRKPTVLHKLAGTYRADRANALEPMPARRLPDRPSWVTDDPTTEALYNAVSQYIHTMGIATEVDGIAMGLLADQLALYIELRAAIREDGAIIVVEGSSGQERRIAHPAIPQLAQTLANVTKLLREYGLTAASRANVTQIDSDTVDTFEDFLN